MMKTMQTVLGSFLVAAATAAAASERMVTNTPDDNAVVEAAIKAETGVKTIKHAAPGLSMAAFRHCLRVATAPSGELKGSVAEEAAYSKCMDKMKAAFK